MNTVHFALQAALSKIILLFQAKGLDAAVEMSWKDYFMRGSSAHLLGLSFLLGLV
jgi:solute carrier family 35 protein C2